MRRSRIDARLFGVLVISCALLAVLALLVVPAASEATTYGVNDAIWWGAPDRPLDHPRGIAASPDGQTIYVADTGNNRVIEYSPVGVVTGFLHGPFDRPMGIATDKSGAVYVANYGSNQVLKFTPEEVLVARWSIGSPVGIATYQNRVYVLTGFFGEVAVRDRHGNDLGAWRAVFPDAFVHFTGYSHHPVALVAAIATDKDGNVIVAGTSRQRLVGDGPDCSSTYSINPGYDFRPYANPLDSGELVSYSPEGSVNHYTFLNPTGQLCPQPMESLAQAVSVATDPSDGSMFVPTTSYYVQPVRPDWSAPWLGAAYYPPPGGFEIVVGDSTSRFGSAPRPPPYAAAIDCQSNLYVASSDRVFKYNHHGGGADCTRVSFPDDQNAAAALGAGVVESLGQKYVNVPIGCEAACGGTVTVLAGCGAGCRDLLGYASFGFPRAGPAVLHVRVTRSGAALLARDHRIPVTIRVRLRGHRRPLVERALMKSPSRLTATCGKRGVVGSRESVTGTIQPGKQGDVVHLTIHTPTGGTIHVDVRTAADGRWHYHFVPGSAGPWAVDAFWGGGHARAGSAAQCVAVVTKQPTAIVLHCPPANAPFPYTFTGHMLPALRGRRLEIVYATDQFKGRVLLTNAAGGFSDTFGDEPVVQAYVRWRGDPGHQGATSNTCSVSAAPVTLSRAGNAPTVALSADGVGHVAWNEHHSGAADTTRYCNLTVSATSCTPGSLTPATGGSNDYENSRPYVFLPDASHELLLDARCCASSGALDKFLLSSGDSGGSFAVPVLSGAEPGSGSGIGGQAIYLPGGTVTGLAGAQIATINGEQSLGADLQVTVAGADPSTSFFHVTSGPTVSAGVAAAGGTLLADYVTLNGQLFWRVYQGGSPNSDAAWSPAELLDTAATTRPISMAGGPGGIFMLYAQPAGGHPVYVVRQFTGTAGRLFSPATTVTEPGAGSAYLSEDPGGGLHLVWQDATGSLRYRYTKDAAHSVWSNPQTLARPRIPGYENVRAASDATGRGWAVWDSSVTGVVQALALAPGEP